MVKVHRAYRSTWWKERYPFAGMTYAAWEERMNRYIPVNKERYTLPFVHYDGDGIIPPAPLDQQALSQEQHTAQQYQRRLEQNRARREKEHMGVPGGIDDILIWYAAYLNLADRRNPEKQAPMTKDSKEDHYRDTIIDLYRASGYSIEESVSRAYSPQGDETMRYLSDDKRHPLNRNREGEIEGAEELHATV